MTDAYTTAGEKLVSRHLEKEMRAGVEHYKPGQLSAKLIGDEEAIFVFLSWVNQMGHVVCMPVVRRPDCEWEPMGVYREAGPAVIWGPKKLDDDYTIPEKTLRFLREAEESWQLNAS